MGVRRPGFVLRGGGWNNNHNNAAAVYRNRNNPNNRNNENGFRVALSGLSLFSTSELWPHHPLAADGKVGS